MNNIPQISHSKTSISNVLLCVFAIATVRDFLEVALQDKFLLVLEDPWHSLKLYFLHFNSFYFLIFIALTLMLYAWGRKTVSLAEVFRIGAVAMTAIWLGPVIDYVFDVPYDMAYPNNPASVLANLHRFADPTYSFGTLTPGMRVEILLVGLASGVFLSVKKNGAVKSVLGGLSMSLLCLCIGLLVPFLTQVYEYGFDFSDEHKLSNSTLLHQGFLVSGSGRKISLLYASLIIVLGSIAYYLRDARKWKCIVANMRFTRSLHYLLLFFAGVFFTLKHPPMQNVTYMGDFEFLDYITNNPFNVMGIIMGALSIFLSFQAAVIFNDIQDYHIDRVSNSNRPLTTHSISFAEYRDLGGIMLVAALFIALCINEGLFMMVLLYNLLAHLYSTSPVRLRNYPVVSNLVLAFIFVLTFHAGSVTILSSYKFNNIPTQLTFSLLLCFMLASTIKDAKDSEGDRVGGVSTLYTLFSRRWAGYVTVALVCLAILLFPWLLGFTDLLWFSVAIASAFVVVAKYVTRPMLKELCITLLYFAYMLVLFCALLEA